MRSETMEKMMKRLISFMLVAAFVLSAISGGVPMAITANAAGSGGDVYCNVKFSKPAICCDAGQTIDLTKCGVQFSASSAMVNSGITWTYDGATVDTFTPDAKGVYSLTAKWGGTTKTIYVVAKNAEENEYVLYRNDFNSSTSDLRVVETTNGGTAGISGGAYVLNGSGHTSAYVRVLLPKFLDEFGDAKMEAGINMTAAVNSTKWASLMYRVQNGNYPYYQGCLRYDATASNGVEISQRNASDKWEVYREKSFRHWYAGEYNICSITAKGTEAILNINGYDVLSYANTAYATGAFGFQTRGARVAVDYVEVTIEGNDPLTTSCDVSYAKPAIRADMGDTIDLKNCDVQFTVNALYTSGSDITWKKNGSIITSFTPSQAGVTLLTATSGGTTKNIYVVTRNLTDGEYVLYRNDFDTAPTDFRIVQQTGASIYHNGAGNYVIDASGSNTSYGRVLLPTFLDEFGDIKIEARYMDTNPNTERNWSSLMARVQNGDYPYMQLCTRYNAALTDGVEFSERNSQNAWSIKKATSFDGKSSNAYNTYSLVMQSNKAYGYINGEQVISYTKNLYVKGAMGLQAKGLKITVDYVKVTLGETTAEEDTAVKCTVAKGRPAIGCNVGQTVLLDECNVQFIYGSPAVDASQIVWKKDGKVITEFSSTTAGMHQLTATYGGMTMNVYVVAKKTTASDFVLYSNDFSTAPLDFRVPETSNGGSCYQLDGNFVLNGSANANSYVRVILPSYLDEFGDARLEASIKLTAPVDSTKWGSVMYRVQNGNYPYMQACLRYDATAENGVEISQKNASNIWEVYNKTSTGRFTSGGCNEVYVDAYCKNSLVSINGTGVLSYNDTPYYNGGWGFQVRGTTMVIDWVRIIFTNNNSDLSLYTIPGNYADVRDPATGIKLAPALITDVKTKADFDNLLNSSPAIAIMNYDVVDGNARIVFSDGSVSGEEALHKLGGRIIPAFRISDNADADSLASFLIGHDLRDAYAVSSKPSVVSRAYGKWKYIRGVVDYSSLTSFDPEDIRYEALENGARVVILPETATKEAVTAIQDSFSCVWLTVSEGKTASVAATNKGPYGLITPDRALTEACYQTFYKQNTLVRRVNVIGHRGNPSVAQENTIAGAQSAFANGATAVENDIYLCADGVLMVMHDATIDRTTNGSGSTVSFTSTQLKQYYVDYMSGIAKQPIPSLEEYFQLVKGNKDQRLVVEIKHPNGAFAQELARLIKKYDIMDQMVIIAFDKTDVCIDAIRALLPGVAVGWLNSSIAVDDSEPILTVQTVLETIQGINTVFNPKYTGWGPAQTREFMYRGVTLWPWTINDRTQFNNLMINGVGGITTNYSQWSKDYVENLTINSAGRVIATMYGGKQVDVTTSAEFVVVEDTIGISCTNGVVNIPATHEGGKASYFFRYKSTSPQGTTYYTVTDVVSVDGHSYEAIVTPPTCTEAGYTTHKCPICGDSYVTDEVPAVGHSYENYICTVCGDVTNITVYFDSSAKGWANVNAHTWNAAGDTTVWPGEAMTLVSGNLYSIQIPGNMTSVVFNDGGTYQTGDLTIPGDGYIYNGYQWVPYGDHVPSTFYVTGDGDLLGNWDAAFGKGMMTNLGGGIHTVTFEAVPAGIYEYKVTMGTWDHAWGYGGGNFTFIADAPSNVTIIFDANAYNTTLNVECLHSYEAVVTAPTCTEGGYTTYTCPCGHSYIGDQVAATGHNHEAVVTAPTCTEGGYTTYICICGDSYIADEVAATGHSYKNNVCTVCGDVQSVINHNYTKTVTDATCTEEGSIVYTCTTCGDSYSETIPATGHSYQSEVTAPTCTEAGYTTHKCSACGDSYVTDEVPAVGHSYENYVCTVCGDAKIITIYFENSAKGWANVNAHTWNATGDTTEWPGVPMTLVDGSLYSIQIPGTMTSIVFNNGTHQSVDMTIPGDGYVYNGYQWVPYDDHVASKFYVTGDGDVLGNWDVAFNKGLMTNLGGGLHSVTFWGVPAGTYEYKVTMGTWDYAWGYGEGNFSFTVSAPSNVTIIFDANANSTTLDVECLHSYFVTVTAPTCTEGGYTTYDCPCGHSYIADKVAATGHSHEAVITAPGCTEGGYTTYTCHCGDSYIADEVAATGHNYDAVITPPTCTGAGFTTYTCFDCGDSYVADETAASGHSYESVVTVPTCTAMGYTTYTCTVCDDSYTDDMIPATGHSYVDGVCANCGNSSSNDNTPMDSMFALVGANMTLGTELAMNFYIDPADLNGTDYYAVITIYKGTGTEETTVPYEQWKTYGSNLYVTLSGMAAKNMADGIEVVIYNGNGTQASYLWIDSVRSYVSRILEKQNAEAKTMLVDMLNYGAAAQVMFNYNTEDLANNALTEEQLAYATDTVSVTDQRVKGDGYYGSNLKLEDQILLTLYFDNINPDMYAIVTFTDHYGDLHETRVEGSDFYQYSSSVYGVMVDELVVADGSQLVTVKVYDTAGNMVAYGTDSINSYAARQMGKDPLYEMVAKFTTSAYEFFH